MAHNRITMALTFAMMFVVFTSVVCYGEETVWMRNSITPVSAVVRTNPAVNVTDQQMEVFKQELKKIIMTRVHFKESASLPTDISNKLIQSLQAGPMNEETVKDALNRIAVPTLVKVLQAGAVDSLRTIEGFKWDRKSFIREKANEIGITEKDLEKLMDSAFLYVPYLSKVDMAKSGDKWEASIKGGIYLYKLSVNPPEVIYFGAYEPKESIVGKMFKTTGKDKLSAFRNEVRGIAKNMAMVMIDDPRLKIKVRIVNHEGGKVGMHPGSREHVLVDDIYKIYEEVADQEGNIREEYIGHVRVSKVGDNKKDTSKLSWAKPVLGGGGMFEGMIMREHPTSGVEFHLNIGWNAMTVDELSVGSSVELDEASSDGYYAADGNMLFNVGRRFGISQLFFTFGGGYGFIPLDIQVGGPDGENVSNGNILSFKVGAMKRFYHGPFSVHFEGSYGFYNKFWFRKTVDETDYELSNKYWTIIAGGGIDIALGVSWSIGISGGYSFYDEDEADWMLKVDDLEVSPGGSDMIDVNAGGAYARLTVSHALDWIPWSPF